VAITSSSMKSTTSPVAASTPAFFAADLPSPVSCRVRIQGFRASTSAV
jgi:hypothetical protein